MTIEYKVSSYKRRLHLDTQFPFFHISEDYVDNKGTLKNNSKTFYLAEDMKFPVTLYDTTNSKVGESKVALPTITGDEEVRIIPEGPFTHTPSENTYHLNDRSAAIDIYKGSQSVISGKQIWSGHLRAIRTNQASKND